VGINQIKDMFYWFLTAVCVCQFVLVLPVFAQPWVGSGTEGDPYQLFDVNDIQAIGLDPNFWDAHFRLQADVDMGEVTGMDFDIIGDFSTAFTGVFDGNGHKIHNFTYEAYSKDNAGFFGRVNHPDAMIKDVQLLNPSFDAGWGNNVGALVANMEAGTIIRCSVKGGFVLGDHSVGGLIGRISKAELTDCSAETVVTGKAFFTGGLASSITSVDANNLYSHCTVTGDDYVGGLFGLCSGKSTVTHCYSAGSVTGDNSVGAFVGRHWDVGVYDNCFWDNTFNPSLPGISNRYDPNVTGISTEDMKQMATFTDAGWDFVGESINGTDDIWNIVENLHYPRLEWEFVPGGYYYDVEIAADAPLIWFRFEEDDIGHDVNVVNYGSYTNLQAKYIGAAVPPRSDSGKVRKGVFLENQASSAILITSPNYEQGEPDFSHDYALTPGDMTIELWFRSGYGSHYYDAGTGWNLDYPRLFSNCNGTGSFEAARAYFTASQYGIGAGIDTSSPEQYSNYMWPFHPGWDPNADPNHNTGPADYQWHHAVMTIDTNDTDGHDPNTDPPLVVEFYLDGALLSSRLYDPIDPNITGILGPEFREFLIGAGGNSDNIYNDFYGAFDEFAIYSKVLPVDRVIAHYQQGLATESWVPVGNCEGIFKYGWNLPGDYNADCYVNFKDFAYLSNNWLRCIEPNDANCEKPWLE